MIKVIKENNKEFQIYSNSKIALRSGYYFQIFNSEEVENLEIDLRETSINIKYNDEIFKLYEGLTWQDVQKIDNLFGNQIGYDVEIYSI